MLPAHFIRAVFACCLLAASGATSIESNSNKAPLSEPDYFEQYFSAPLGQGLQEKAFKGLLKYLVHRPRFSEEAIQQRLIEVISKINRRGVLFSSRLFKLLEKMIANDIEGDSITVAMLGSLIATGKKEQFGLRKHGIRDLLISLDTKIYSELSEDQLFGFLGNEFAALVGFESFSGFAIEYMHHLHVILNLLGDDYVDDIITAFVNVKISYSSASTAHLALFGMLARRFGFDSDIEDVVYAMPIKSETGRRIKRELLGGMSSSLPEEDESIVFSVFEPVSFLGFIRSCHKLIETDSKVEENRAEYLGQQLLEYAEHRVDLKEYVNDIQNIMSFGMIIHPNIAMETLKTMTTEKNVQNEEYKRLASSIFVNLQENDQLTFLMHTVEMYIATRDVHYLLHLENILLGSRVTSTRLAEIGVFLYSSVLEWIDGKKECKSMALVMKFIAPHLPENQYNRLLVKLTQKPVVDSRKTPIMRLLIMRSVLMARPVTCIVTVSKIRAMLTSLEPRKSKIGDILENISILLPQFRGRN